MGCIFKKEIDIPKKKMYRTNVRVVKSTVVKSTDGTFVKIYKNKLNIRRLKD